MVDRGKMLVTFEFTLEEFDWIRNQARLNDLSISSFIVRRVLNCGSQRVRGRASFIENESLEVRAAEAACSEGGDL